MQHSYLVLLTINRYNFFLSALLNQGMNLSLPTRTTFPTRTTLPIPPTLIHPTYKQRHFFLSDTMALSYQIRLNSHRLVKSKGVRSKNSEFRRRENHFDERSYDDWRIFLCPIRRI